MNITFSSCPRKKSSMPFFRVVDRRKRRGVPGSTAIASCSGRLVSRSAWCSRRLRPITTGAITTMLGAVTALVSDGLLVARPAAAATPDRRAVVETAGIPRIDDYAAAGEAARATQAMLLVSVEPNGGDPSDSAGQHLERAAVQERFLQSGTPWVFCRLGMHEAGGLVGDPSLVEMRRGPGVFVVDHTGGPLTGRIVSILPRTTGKYYRFSPSHIDQLASLPSGTLTQRSMILAVRIHPENPQSTFGTCHPVLCQEAAAHSAHQARIRTQGHHNWGQRSQRIVGNAGGAGSAAEVCAESWENQDLLDSCVDCVASWRQSSGHWTAVRSPQSAYGYDIRRDSNGIWYATGIFLR